MSGTNYIASNWRVPENSNSSKNDNYSLSFDGGTEELAWGQTDLGPNHSICFWVKVSTGANGYRTILVDDGAYPAFTNPTRRIYVRQLDGKLHYVDGNSAGSTTATSNTSAYNTLTDGEWHHIAIVRADTVATIYIDGQDETLDSTLGAWTTPYYLTQTGYDITGFGGAMAGALSDISFFDYALDSSQVSTLYGNATSGAGNPMALKPTPVAYYPLGDNSSGDPVTQPNVSVDDASVFDFDPAVPNYIDCGTLPYFETAQTSFSISFWFNQNAVGGQAFSIGNRVYFIIESNRIQCWNIGPTTGRADTTGDIYSIGTWFHFMCTYDGTGATDTDKFKVWINGVPNTLNFVTSPPVSTLGTSARTTIASNFNNSSSANIKMSNVAVWSTNESAEVSNIYNDGVPATSYTNTPLAWYKLDQSANWEADTAGNWQVPDAVSAYPQSFDFDGSDYISASPTGISSAITVSAWIKTSTTGIQTIVNEDQAGGAGTRNWNLLLEPGNKIQVVIVNTDGTVNNKLRSTALEVQDGNWHHIVFTYDGTANVDGLKTYVDGGNLESFQTTSTGIITTDTLGVYIGSLQVTGAWPFSGNISNIQIWDTNLDDTQIEALYNNGTPLTTAIQSTNLKGWWKLDDTELFDNTNWSVENQKYPAGFDSALNFDGSDYIDVSTISLGTTQTLSWWINRDSSSTQECPFGDTTSGLSDMLVYMNGLTLYYRVGSTSLAWTNALSTALTNQKWCNIILIRNGASAKLYLNGDFVSEQTLTGGDITAAVQVDRIGASSAGTPAFYINGKLSNVAIWNTDQTAEVSNIYNNGTPTLSYTNTPSNWYKLNNTTTGIQDSVGSNDGTNNGATKVNIFVSTESATSSNMTEQSLVNNNVSTLNGESSGMTSGNLVLSDLTRNLPYENYSFNFDKAQSDYALTTGTALSGDITFSFWINMNGTYTAFTNNYPASIKVSNISVPNQGLGRIYINGGAGGNVMLQVKDETGLINDNFYINEDLRNTGWRHCVWTYNVTTENIYFYLDGVVQEWTRFNGGTLHPYLTAINLYNSNLQIGTNTSTTGAEWDGGICQVAMFDTVLTSTEIQKLYANGMPQDLTNFTPQPTSWFPMGKESFWDGSNWILRDMIGGNDATGTNISLDDLVGDAPRSEANGTGTNMDIPTNLVGNAGFSDKNAYSINMSPSARVTDTP